MRCHWFSAQLKILQIKKKKEMKIPSTDGLALTNRKMLGAGAQSPDFIVPAALEPSPAATSLGAREVVLARG